MNDQEAEAIDFGSGQGGINAAHVATTQSNLVLRVRKSIEDLNTSSGRLATFNLALTAIVLLVAIIQLSMAGSSSSQQANQRFTVFGADGDVMFVLDTKTGLPCATGLPGGDAEKEKVGETLTISTRGGVFAPYCADLYANEGRVLRDFQAYLHRPSKSQVHPPAK